MRPFKTTITAAKTISLAIGLTFFLSHCGLSSDAGTRVGNPPTVSTTNAFPESLAIASPLDNSDALSESSSLSLFQATEDGTRSAYEEAVERINTILEGTSLTTCRFDPTQLLRQAGNAECYGPSIAYVDHPDTLAAQSDSGSLPPGDLGIWAEYDEPSEANFQTEQACAAAQLNQRMRGMHFKSQSSLEALASLLCVASVNDIAIADEGSVDLKTAMQTMSDNNELDVTFDTADLSITVNADGTITFEYEIEFSFTDDDGEHDATVNMTHVALSSDGDYKGRFSYTVEDSDAVQNNCPEDGITHAGSTLYSKTADGDVSLLVDEGGFCGLDVDPVQDDGLIDPSDGYAASNPDGWGVNFSTAIANFNNETRVGNYALVWQAGPSDSHTRAFNVTLDELDSGLLSGTAFFGFGAPIDETDGGIDGFICNWAGPGGVHTLSDDVQRQGLLQNADGLFDSVTAELAIGYAPTNSCTYDGLGTFSYDLDPTMNGTTMSDPATAVANDLLELTDTTFTEAGFVLPTAPENF